MEEPCRFMGTFHRLSRGQVETLRMEHRITSDEWKCTAGKLAEVDRRFTRECNARPVAYPDLVQALRDEYSRCFPADRQHLVDEAMAFSTSL